MKLKTTAIAMAVASIVAPPVAVQAGAGELYASARVGVWNLDEGGVNDLDVRSFDSRFGAEGGTDLGNGLTGFGRYEWDVDFNNDIGENTISVRHRYVGLEGDFGSVLAGQDYHTFYNFVVGPLDIPWWHSGYAMVAFVGRTDDAITYAGGSDNFTFGVTGYMVREAEEDPLDVYELGARYTFDNDMALSLAVQGTEADLDDGTGTLIGNSNDEPVVGVLLSGVSLGPVKLAIGGQSQDDDTSVALHADISNFYAHFELEFLDEDSPANGAGGEDQDRVSSTLGYTQNLGRKTTAYYEFNHIDNDTGDSDDDRTAIMAVLKYDII